MKKALMLSLAAMLMVPAVSTVASAHPAPHPHYHSQSRSRGHARRVKVRRYRRARYRPAPVVVMAPPPVVVYQPAPVYVEPAPEVVYVQQAPAPRQVVVVSEPAVAVPVESAPSRTRIGVGLRFTGASLEGEKLGLSTAENPALGGAGLQMRVRFDKGWGMELALDVLGGGGDDFKQRTIPMMASLTKHFFHENRFQPYIIGGLGVHFTRTEYLGGKYNFDTTEFAGQLGAGLEVFLSENLSIQGDVRTNAVFSNLDTQAKIRQDCISQVGRMSGFCDGINGLDPDSKMSLGVQLQAGVNWYF